MHGVGQSGKDGLPNPSNEQRAVIYSVYNRALNRNPPAGGSTLCGQVYADNQYSWTRTDIQQAPRLTGQEEVRYTAIIQKIMDEIENGTFGPASCATHYHTVELAPQAGMSKFPSWSVKSGSKESEKMQNLGEVGPHIFMRDTSMVKCINLTGETTLKNLSAQHTPVPAHSSLAPPSPNYSPVPPPPPPPGTLVNQIKAIEESNKERKRKAQEDRAASEAPGEGGSSEGSPSYSPLGESEESSSPIDSDSGDAGSEDNFGEGGSDDTEGSNEN